VNFDNSAAPQVRIAGVAMTVGPGPTATHLRGLVGIAHVDVHERRAGLEGLVRGLDLLLRGDGDGGVVGLFLERRR